MTQEEKQLLIKDLCARLPHNLYIRVEEFNVPKNDGRITEGFIGNYLKDNRCTDYDTEGILNELADNCINVKPYLRSMSSMTEEEEIEYDATFATIKLADGHYDSTMTYKSFDFLNAHHFDFRNLIECGLSIEVTKENNPYKE